MSEPVWIEQDLAHRIHASVVELHGGASGIRDEGLLLSALERPKNLWHYSSPKPDLPSLAASLAHGIAKNHPFLDGNKRTAWVLCRLLLRCNGFVLSASQEQKTEAMLSLAAGVWSEQKFAEWLTSHLLPDEA